MVGAHELRIGLPGDFSTLGHDVRLQMKTQIPTPAPSRKPVQSPAQYSLFTCKTPNTNKKTEIMMSVMAIQSQKCQRLQFLPPWLIQTAPAPDARYAGAVYRRTRGEICVRAIVFIYSRTFARTSYQKGRTIHAGRC